MDESLASGPKLAWQPAEAAFRAEPTTVADEPRRTTVNFDEERRSTLSVPGGAHPKDVQWNRIRELTENLQKEREISASLTTRFHDFQRDAAAQQRQMQQIVETKELTARAQTAELEAYREAVRNREQQLHDDVARLQARAVAAELELERARAQLAAMVEAKAAEEEVRLAALAKAQAEKEARENDEDALEGNERGLEMVERALVNALRASSAAGAAGAAGEEDAAAAASTRETVEAMIGEGRSGGQIASTLVQQALAEGRRVAELGAHDLARRWKEERAVRRQLQNALQELKGSIRVMCRVRPLSSAERAHGEEEVVQPSNDMACTLIDPSKPGARKHFGYDRVFAPSSSQVDVFEEVEPLVPSVFDGYNLCVFAYGQTGSGKTHTMQGSAEAPGLGPRLLGALFTEAAERRALAATSAVGKAGASAGAASDADNWEFTVSVSYLEVYNEQVRDLLAPGAKPTVVDVRQGTANEISIPGLTSVVVADEAEVNDTLRLGASKRAVGATSMNAHSSRSHSLILATIVGRHAGTGATSSGKLYLVDLAGSERVSRSGVCGEQMKEAQNINRSLSALGDVMAALQAKQAHVPYRNSKLTQLLSDSLGGRSKSIMFVNVSPAADSASESLCSLNFAARVGNVELATTKRGGGGGGGANGSALALKLSRETEDKLRAELLEARERVGAAERRVADAQRALADEQARASESVEEARSEREGVEFAARAELDRLSSQLSLEARQRELSEAALAKAREGSSAELQSLRLELERTRAELARAQDAAAKAMAAVVPAAEERKQPPTDDERAAAVAALRQQAVAARAAVSAGAAGFAPAAQHAPSAPAPFAPPPLAPPSAPALPLAFAPLAPQPLAPTPVRAAPGLSSVSKIVSFFEPAADAKSPLPAPRAAAATCAAVVDSTPSATPTRGLSARAPGGTPRAAAQQMRQMPAVQALYGADALGSLDDLNLASDALPAPMLPTSVWAAPPSAPVDAAAEKENAANDARSTATGQLVPWSIAGHAPVAEPLGPPALKSSLKATSSFGTNPITIPIKFAPMPAVHAQQMADPELHRGAHGPSCGNVPSYLEQTKSSSAHNSRFAASTGLSALGSAQRVVAGKARADKAAQPRESEAGGRRMSLIARQSVPTGDSLRRKAGESQPPALGSLNESYGHGPAAAVAGANKKPRRF